MQFGKVLSAILSTLLFLSFVDGYENTNSQNETIGITQDSAEFEVSTLTTEVPPKGDGISVADNGDIYISGRAEQKNIFRVTPLGEVTTFAIGLNSAHGSDFDSMGNLYVADYRGNAIRKVTPNGILTTFASDLNGPGGVYIDHEENVIVGLFGADFPGRVQQF